jgi:YidC/Oxa1 family membrane protein insertase
MDRNSIFGLLLIAAIMIGYTFMVSPSKEELEREKLLKDSIALEMKAKEEAQSKLRLNVNQPDSSRILQINDSIANQKKAENLGDLAETLTNEVKTFNIENDFLKIRFSTQGASIDQVELKEFKTHDGKPLIVFNPDSTQLNAKLPLGNKLVGSNELVFSTTNEDYVIKTNDSLVVNFDLVNAQGEKIAYNYTIKGNSYLIDFSIDLKDAGNLINPIAKTIGFDWKAKLNRQEKSIENERNNTTIYYRTQNEDVDYIAPTSNEKEKLEQPLNWVAFKQQFFSSVFVSKSGFESGAEIETALAADAQSSKNLKANLQVPFDYSKSKSLEFSFYYGPNHYKTLKAVDLGLEKQIPLGWGIFGWVNRFIVIPVFNFLDGFNLNYGIVILILTLVIKLLLLPLQFKSYMSQAKMRVLKPEVDELNKKFGTNDALKKQQAMMELYKKAGVNPLGGCVPLLFQMPILFAMFSFFPAAIELRQQSFLWATDLSTYDSIYTLPFSIPAYGDHVSLFALLMTISTILYTRMNQQFSAQNEQMAQLKWLMYLMPVVFLFVLNSYAAGLNYYYFLANIITFGQQFAFTKLVDEKKIHAIIEKNKKSPKANKTSAFQKKLEEMAQKRNQQLKK